MVMKQLNMGRGQLGVAEKERQLYKQSQEVFGSIDLRWHQWRAGMSAGSGGL